MKVVINKCWGGFGLSEEAESRYLDLKDILDLTNIYSLDIRSDPILVQVVEELGDAANDSYSKLVIVEIPDNVEWYIHDYDGRETIHEKHRSW